MGSRRKTYLWEAGIDGLTKESTHDAYSREDSQGIFAGSSTIATFGHKTFDFRVVIKFPITSSRTEIFVCTSHIKGIIQVAFRMGKFKLQVGRGDIAQAFWCSRGRS